MTILRRQSVRAPHIELPDVGNPQTTLLTLPSVADGSLLVLFVSENDASSGGVTGVSDSVNGAWTNGVLLSFAEGGWTYEDTIWYLRNASAGSHVVTVSFGVSTDWTFASILAAEYTGVPGALIAIASHLNPAYTAGGSVPPSAYLRRSGSITAGDRALFVAAFGGPGGRFFTPHGGSLGTQGSNLISTNDSVFTTNVSGYQGGWVDIPPNGPIYPATITRATPPVAPPSPATYAMRIHASDVGQNGGASTRPSHAIAVTPGNEYTLQADLLGDAAGDFASVSVLFLAADGTYLGTGPEFFPALNATTWVHAVSQGVQAPYGAAVALLQFTTSAIFDGMTSNAHDMWVTNLVLLGKPYSSVWEQAAQDTGDFDADSLLLDRGVGTDGVAFGTANEVTVQSSDSFYSVGGLLLAFGMTAPPPPPLPPPPAVNKWQFFDPSNGGLAVFAINPSEGGSPGYDKQFAYESHGAGSTSGNAPMVFETADSATELSVSGTIIAQDAYTMFASWFERSQPVMLIDDLGRQFLVVIKTFRPKRVWSGQKPWKHTYDLTALVLRQTFQ